MSLAYSQAAQYIGRVAPQETDVAYWGSHGDTFIYGMRAYSGRSDLGIVRLSKLLVSYRLTYALGFTQKDLNPQQIVDELRLLHVQYVVVQTGFGEQIDVIKKS